MNNKLILTGRYTGLVFLLMLFFLSSNSFASIDSFVSENVQVEGDRISIQAKGTTLVELLKEIMNRTEIEFKLSKTLREQEITVGFKELSLLEGIKKIIYPMNYIIVNDKDGKIHKVIIMDQSNTSTMMASNEKIEEFYADSQVGSNFEGTQVEGGGDVHNLPGLEFNLTEHPSGTNMLVQAPAFHGTTLNESPPGIDILGREPPDPEIAFIEGPPETDAFVQEPPAPEIALSEWPTGIDLFMAQEGINPPPGE